MIVESTPWACFGNCPEKLGWSKPSSEAAHPQVHLMTGHEEGLAFWEPPQERQWQRWTDWPHVLLCADQGSDGLCSAHALGMQGNLKINLTTIWDPAHSAWRDMLAGLRQAGLQSWVYLAMITMNLPHGPEATDMRMAQIQQAMSHYFDHHSAEASALFVEHLPGILLDLGPDLPETGLDKAAPAFEWFKGNSLFFKKGRRTSLARIQSVSQDGLTLLGKWHCYLLQAEYICLELDFFKAKRT